MHPDWQTALWSQKQVLETLEQQLFNLPDLSPNAELVMAAFVTSPSQVRVVIIGQDPYPTPGVAVGRAFAVAHQPVPASLRNILKELDSDLGADFGDIGPALDLSGWQEQGVFLLNRHLTTVNGQPGAHFKLGWQTFTDAALEHLAGLNPDLILVLWGKEAESVLAPLETAGFMPQVVRSVHPSPLSAHRGFFGSKPFSAINALLVGSGQTPINWKS